MEIGGVFHPEPRYSSKAHRGDSGINLHFLICMLTRMYGRVHFSEEGVHGFSNKSIGPPKLRTAEIGKRNNHEFDISKMLTLTKCVDILKHFIVGCVIIDVFYR